MDNRYNRSDAQQFITTHPHCCSELALRVYTSRLIGRENSLVLHGGGNTSVKAQFTTLLGDDIEVLYIKGSGWDLATIEPQGFPALDLAYLRRLRALPSLADEEMVNQFKTHMLDSTAPSPSIETLVHAFLPHRYIDHTHADAIVTLTNMAEPEERLSALFGNKVAILPWIMPGFPLAKVIAECFESRPDIEAIILRNHGIFTFGDEADLTYGRMIHYVTVAEDYLRSHQPINQAVPKTPATSFTAANSDNNCNRLDPALILPLLRGAMTIDPAPAGATPPFLLHLRTSETIDHCLCRDDARAVYTTGVLTPDHVIRTKNYPLWLDLQGLDEEQAAQSITRSIAEYEQHYTHYFHSQIAAKQVARSLLDPKPRVILIPGLGIVAAGTTEKAARIAADIGEQTLLAKSLGAAIAPYRELGEEHIFDMEYWSLEQAKLKKGNPLPLSGRIALVTGGGGAIACGIGRKLLAAGARVFLSDIDNSRLQRVCSLLAQEFDPALVSGIAMDVTDSRSVARGLEEIILNCGGLDILVPNAGMAHVATLSDLDETTFRKVLDVNLLGVFQIIQKSIPVFKRQARTGHLPAQIIINSSKNVFAPGAAFGAYSASKAGAHQLGKIAALELAEIGARVNMINADGIFDDHGISSGLWDVVGPDRMRSRNLDPEGLKEYYRNRNLLKTEVLADHVGNAVVFFASGLTPTTGATLPVDGGVASAFPR
jgi:rhamnose utilization protein RhaD (predicted bifunctional aldolase and dehydrogenase)/NAD(P)-dependent dehydrogenase (short-subunit alcohol dehydrogenase family)